MHTSKQLLTKVKIIKNIFDITIFVPRLFRNYDTLAFRKELPQKTTVFKNRSWHKLTIHITLFFWRENLISLPTSLLY